ncbi:DUF2959 domain-containing protein [methanotrophic endosymbiont of Bathymodiolus puteoserpentis (Logatchev)]|uniref:DUF2959 domain-containing protein n=1 Tax=methanotrophic endosymbiont of Bathymodiolus puteoserpentis (Logatchev) TaxID=343235 RepID=UPI0013C9C8AD|nr:DUF2959 domain-containing protein [methanotrophic endosymbiont of Bathymodiolus puteoserpentis (Logatchev)]SHE23717.1 FIG00859276: hypothetical protein [methanotrophic endosymbiont of Bathymodiolus puteoserpentis (Logatchev)]
MIKSWRLFTLALVALSLPACSSMYYSGLEKIGIPKRDIMVHRVEKARDTQQDAKEQFKTTLEQFSAVTQFKGGDLEAVYNKLNSEYEASKDEAAAVSKRIADIEDVSAALFAEWKDEADEFSSAALRRNSLHKLAATKQQYDKLISAMHRAEAKMPPVLAVFKDQVLILKHSLNAQAIASLKNDLASVESDVNTLIKAMNQSISEADDFIKTMEKN